MIKKIKSFISYVAYFDWQSSRDFIFFQLNYENCLIMYLNIEHTHRFFFGRNFYKHSPTPIIATLHTHTHTHTWRAQSIWRYMKHIITYHRRIHNFSFSAFFISFFYFTFFFLFYRAKFYFSFIHLIIMCSLIQST